MARRIDRPRLRPDADICIGIIGVLIGSWLLPRMGIHLGAGIVAATIGATVLLLILRLVNRRGRW